MNQRPGRFVCDVSSGGGDGDEGDDDENDNDLCQEEEHNF